MQKFMKKLALFGFIALSGLPTIAQDLHEKLRRHNELVDRKSFLDPLTASEENELESLNFTLTEKRKAFVKAEQDAELAKLKAEQDAELAELAKLKAAGDAKKSNLLTAKDNHRAAKLAIDTSLNAGFEALLEMIKRENDTKAALLAAYTICKQDYCHESLFPVE